MKLETMKILREPGMGDSFCSGFVAFLGCLLWRTIGSALSQQQHALSWANGQVSTWGCDTVQGALILTRKCH